ncbi:hypothetical protein D1222_09375 [Henriciella algicola]|uniref:Uncharacterized protein n=2 Tax=Henriciella algicola TaxID=1608422 RepID=A0A399RIC6_9PROT|nr:hypothetical protein D1222_09375 [Henriciella algicola]
MGTFRRIETITPLLVFPLIAYVIIAVIAGGQHMDETPAIAGNLNATLFSVPMVSGVSWKMRLGDILLLVSLVLLSIEIMKATSSRSSAMVNHMASMAVLLTCIVCFILFANFATATFFLFTCIALIDVMVGVIVSIVSARRDFGVGDGFGS